MHNVALGLEKDLKRARGSGSQRVVAEELRGAVGGRSLKPGGLTTHAVNRSGRWA